VSGSLQYQAQCDVHTSFEYTLVHISQQLEPGTRVAQWVR